MEEKPGKREEGKIENEKFICAEGEGKIQSGT
jgi:hypothetical protein